MLVRLYLRVWFDSEDRSRVFVANDVIAGTVFGPPEHLELVGGDLVWVEHVEGGKVSSVPRGLFESSCGVLMNGLLERL